jgi:hypothetical protein
MIAIEQQSNNQRGDESNTFEESDFFSHACKRARHRVEALIIAIIHHGKPIMKVLCID